MSLTAESLSALNEGNEVQEWKDASGNGRDVYAGIHGKPIYRKASWDPEISVVQFGHQRFGYYNESQIISCLRTKYLYPVSTSGTYVAVISVSANADLWDLIAAASQDRYWSIKLDCYDWYARYKCQLVMQLLNVSEIRIDVETNTPYIVVARVYDENKRSYLWIWDIKRMKWSGKKETTSKGIPSGNNGAIIIGHCTPIEKRMFTGEIAEFSMWDTFLSDSEVEDLVKQYTKMTKGKNSC